MQSLKYSPIMERKGREGVCETPPSLLPEAHNDEVCMCSVPH